MTANSEGSYVDVDGRKVWVRRLGRGAETVVLLHGGMGNSDELLDTIGGKLAEHYTVVGYDRRGHGRSADTDAPFRHAEMANEAIAVIDKLGGGPVHLVGWSDGGVVALLVALQEPARIARQVLMGAAYHHDGFRKMAKDSGVALRARMKAAYEARSPDGAAHYEVVRDKAVAMGKAEPTLTVDDVRRITAPTLVLVGDDDQVELSHTVSLYEALPAGQLAVVPRASHTVALEQPAETARLIRAFLTATVPPDTMMPSRRPHH